MLNTPSSGLVGPPTPTSKFWSALPSLGSLAPRRSPKLVRGGSCPPAPVIAPPQQKTQTKQGPTTQSTPGLQTDVSDGSTSTTEPSNSNWSPWSVVAGTTSFASQLLSYFKFWPGSTPAVAAAQAERVLQEASSKEKEKQQQTAPADITSLLNPVGVWELKHVRKLSSLCALTYKMHLVTPASLRARHQLELITTSWACELHLYEHSRTPEEVCAEGDGMAVSVEQAEGLYGLGVAESNIVAVPKDLNFQPAQSASSSVSSSSQASAVSPASQLKKWSPADVVGGKLAEAASAASAVAAAASMAAVTPITSAAGNLYASLASLTPSLPFPSTPSTAAANMPSAAIPIAAITAAEVKTASSSSNPSATIPTISPQSSSATPTCPSEWFICDDTAADVRYFVIQGSDTIDHWRLNLTFDPVPFEDPDWGVTVHRGVYEAAKVLYDRFLPHIYEHLDASPFARVAFTGHSIGGSMAILLTLMYKHRGILTNSRIATVYTFGAPAVFCHPYEEYLPPSSGSKPQAPSPPMPQSINGTAPAFEAETWILTRVGLPEHIVRNIIMHKDTVPRAFSCDYSLVADILKTWGPGFRDQKSLNRLGRKHLYYFVGRMLVMQPDSWHWFVNNEPDHPLLPPGPEVYLLERNSVLSSVSAAAHRAAMQRRGQQLGPPVSNVTAALHALMDNPHPLEVLADTGAYLEKGSISRYHNPENYTKALGRVIFLKRKTQEPRPSWAEVRAPFSVTPGPRKAEPEVGGGLDVATDEKLAAWDSSDPEYAIMLENF